MVSTTTTTPATAGMQDEIEVANAVEAFHTALINADKTTLDELLCNDLSYGHSNGMIEEKASLIENIVNKNSDFVVIEQTDQTIRVIEETAIVRHHFIAQTNDRNAPGTVKLIILLVWQKQNSQWKLLARQAVRA